MKNLVTRRLGRTERMVTTLGLGGQGSIQWPGEGADPVAIIEKAVNFGITYLDTSNIYGPSQKHYGEAFLRLGLTPGTPRYDPEKRKGIFLATKTHIRTARRPDKARFRSDYSEGMSDGFGVKTAVDDVRRSLSLLFGNGRGEYPEGSYLDSIQFHNINTFDEVDMLFEGYDRPSPGSPWMGAIAAMADLRDGTNHTGCNPGKEKLVRHLGISGHWSTAALMYAIQRDEKRLLDTLLVAINPSDGEYFGHRHNAIAVAGAAGMGIIGMKVFADAAYYHKEPKFSRSPADVYHGIGSEEIPGPDLIRYSLSVAGVCTVITGIGHIDTDGSKCQLAGNLAAAQMEGPLSDEEMRGIEEKIKKARKHGANSYFQRPALGLTAPRNPGAQHDFSMPSMGRNAVRLSWDTSYAGAWPVEHYMVMRNGELAATITHTPQYTQKRFSHDDILEKDAGTAHLRYRIVAVDTRGNRAETMELTPG